MTESFVLKRVSDGKYFQDPPLGTNEEWTTKIENARTWADIDRAAAAAFTWFRVKGQQLEVHGLVQG